MKKSKIALLGMIAVSAISLSLIAQPSDEAPPPPHEGGPGPAGFRPPKPPVEVALDADGDGTISATEIANAAAALAKLDKNNDGQLTVDELRPPRPKGGPGGPHGQPPRGGNRPQPPGNPPPANQ